MVLSFAFLATVINYLDRQTLAVLAPVLLQRYTISAESYARIISAFMLAYTVSNGVSGRLLDRLGTRLGYALTIAVWSAAEILHALARGAFSFGAFRFLLGLGEAGNYPAGVKLIAEWFPPEERSLASGIFNSGASIGAILAPPLLVWIALNLGTQVVFVLVGASGFVWLAAWLLFYRQPPREARLIPPTVPTRVLLRSRFLWQFTFSKVFSDPVWYFYTFWIPQYLRTAHHFSLKQIGAIAWIPFLTAAIGNMVGGASFAALRRLPIPLPTVRRLCILLFSALMTSALLIPGRTSAGVCIGLMSVATFGYSGALANLLALPADAFPREAVGSVWGLASMGAGFGGMLFSLVTGWLVQHYSFTPAFVLFGTLPVISAVLVWTLPRQADASALEGYGHT